MPARPAPCASRLSTACTAAFAAAACAPAPSTKLGGGVPDDVPELGGGDGTDGFQFDTGDEPRPRPDFDYDCDALPAFNTGDRVLEEARGYHGLAFDDDARLIGWDTRGSIVKTTYEGEREVWVPGVNSMEQITRAPGGGDYFFVDGAEAAVKRLTADGAITRVAGGLYAGYGIVFGPDGMLYVADGGVKRIHPDTGEVTELMPVDPSGFQFTHALQFNLDSTALMIGTIGPSLLRLPLDEELNPSGEVEVFASFGGGWMDAVGVDACGNYWVPEYFTSSLYRVSADGSQVDSMVDARPQMYGHGLIWGTGEGGWRMDALYQPQPYKNATVREVVIGVPDGAFVRTWNGREVEL
jgi:sugar lactone lactonase YvrE